jgi:hypothetical protein
LPYKNPFTTGIRAAWRVGGAAGMIDPSAAHRKINRNKTGEKWVRHPGVGLAGIHEELIRLFIFNFLDAGLVLAPA